MRTLLAPAPLGVGELVITGAEAHHGRTVLRLRVGDAVRIADGAGCAAEGTINAVERDFLRIQLEQVVRLPEDPARLLSVVVAPPKGDRLADMVRGLTELGVGTIRLLACERGERLPGNMERLQRVSAEALKQCQRSHLPRLGPTATIQTLAAAGDELIVLDRTGSAPRYATPRPITVVIGPEGGLTANEVADLLAVGAVAVRVAGPILRIETAALAAAALWASAWEHVRS
jgi:16S rRNA (uracil1498-N3)-methyltransferase